MSPQDRRSQSHIAVHGNPSILKTGFIKCACDAIFTTQESYTKHAAAIFHQILEKRYFELTPDEIPKPILADERLAIGSKKFAMPEYHGHAGKRGAKIVCGCGSHAVNEDWYNWHLALVLERMRAAQGLPTASINQFKPVVAVGSDTKVLTERPTNSNRNRTVSRRETKLVPTQSTEKSWSPPNNVDELRAQFCELEVKARDQRFKVEAAEGYAKEQREVLSEIEKTQQALEMQIWGRVARK